MEKKQEATAPQIQGTWDEKQASEYLGFSQRTLRNMRSLGKGPRYVKFFSMVRYRKSDLDKFIDENVRDPAA
jgi:predicted DNA-binding transcriptional regulator AlpA